MFTKLCKLVSLVLCILLLCGCAAEDEGCYGKYYCTEIISDGVRMYPEEVFNGEVSLELGSGGSGNISLGNGGGLIKWQLDGAELTVDICGEVSKGSLEGDLITLELDESTVLYFAREGSSALERIPGEDVHKLGGSWYGWWKITSAKGAYEEYDGMWYDLCGLIQFTEDSRGSIKLWDEDYTAAEPMAFVYLELFEDGRAVSTAGSFMGDELEQGQWILDLSMPEYESLLPISGEYSDEGGSFSYEIMLRPWGMTWDDVEEAEPDLLPYFYRSWYLPLIEKGEAMPDAMEVEGLRP